MRPQSAATINNRTNFQETSAPQKIKPISIPSVSKPIKDILVLQSQNIFKIQQYQQDHFLDDLENEELKQIPLKKEEILPLEIRFPPKQKQNVQDMQQFLEQQYPAPFHGAQQYKDVEEDRNPFKQYISINKVDLKKKIKKGEQQSQPVTNEQIKPMPILDQIDENLSQIQEDEDKDLDQQVDLIMKQIFPEVKEDQSELDLKDLAQVLTNQLKLKDKSYHQDFEKQPLPIILGLDTREKRDAFRALPLQQQKQVVQKNILVNVIKNEEDEFKNQVLKKKLLDFQNQDKIAKNNFFNIVNELDLLKKGARDIKNKTRQTFALRKKQERSPDIKKLIEEVKGQIWYTPGFMDGYEKELQILKLQNNDIDTKFEVNDDNIDRVLGEVQTDLNNINLTKISEVSNLKQKLDLLPNSEIIIEQVQEPQKTESQKVSQKSQTQINSIVQTLKKKETISVQSKKNQPIEEHLKNDESQISIQSKSTNKTNVSKPSFTISAKAKMMNEMMKEELF